MLLNPENPSISPLLRRTHSVRLFYLLPSHYLAPLFQHVGEENVETCRPLVIFFKLELEYKPGM